MQTLNVLLLLIIFGFGAASMQTTPNNQPDSLASHPGDMREGTYYAGDVVARYAAGSTTDTPRHAPPELATEQAYFLKHVYRYIGADK